MPSRYRIQIGANQERQKLLPRFIQWRLWLSLRKAPVAPWITSWLAMGY